MFAWINWIFTLAYWLVIVLAIIVVLRENRNPIRSLAWVISLIFLPGFGLLFYAFFGRSFRGEHMISRYNKRRIITKMAQRHVELNQLNLSPQEASLVKLCRNLSSSFYTVNNGIKIFTTGTEKFESLKRDLRAAKRSVYLQYYIFMDDRLGTEIADILIEKAQQGLDVKVLYDHVGSFSTSNAFFKRMRSAGVEVHTFFRVTFPQLANRVNWRNHRKIVIIDNSIGYIGGMNIADRYEAGLDSSSPWRDTHFRVEGDIVESLLYSFVVDWNFRKQSQPMEFSPGPKTELSNSLGMQLVTSGPIGDYDNLALCFLKAISSATKCIYIQTPYFLPPDSLLHALEIAALSKIDVRIMMPRRPDSRLLRLASYSYITQCLRAGMKVYLYEPGMLHVKGMIIDDNLVTAGSTNFDFRSFENNFECNLFIYDRDVNRRMRDIFFSDMSHCTKVTISTWTQRPLLQRTLESIIRLISPIL